MDCIHLPILDLQEFNKRLRRSPAPLGGGIELTQRCNLRCVHCYCRQPADSPAARETEMSFETVCRVVDQAADMGCLTLFLTGGEPLLRRDFTDIYEYIVSKGILTILFTNATLLSPRILDRLAGLPPLFVEVSLYGLTQEVYESITGVPGSHAACLRGIHALAERGIKFFLKAPAMARNRHQLGALDEFARSLGSDFRFDVLMSPRLHGLADRYGPYDYTLPLGDRAELELGDEARLAAWEAYVARVNSVPPQKTAYKCGAGKYGFFVGASGTLSMCVLGRHPSYDLAAGTFEAGWQLLRAVRDQVPERDVSPECAECRIVAFCSQCPARAQLEYGLGAATRRVVWLCELAYLRAEKFRELKESRDGEQKRIPQAPGDRGAVGGAEPHSGQL